MAHILFMRLAGPMQSWGTMSRFTRRDTGKEPSKSGVIGLICAAMGIDREDDHNDGLRKLVDARLGIRVLRQGDMKSDYHTASNIAKAEKGTKDTELSTRFYLSDADFIAALESDDQRLLERVHDALKQPKWQLFLGRKAFVPSLPVYFADDAAIIDSSKGLKEELANDELLSRLGISYDKKRQDDPQRLVIEDPQGSEVRSDVPLSFAERRFTIRRVATSFVDIKGGDNNGTIS
ncbi:type I-E CRISPR-associated protein Cas5/CasD [Leptolyngbya sp. 7M]|uniref:type I-E CRISPR-associated protein Cas5/CasD n=1 Tax=Leptolyngbya sp. 7M TaxID=2812896 RepID=UPI001B8C1F4E|nr:type I-E CRISPR-associated protein Cas5/CasD [Leptolyngbya sp. 7M]QYO66150.1 type I-E CRISPR-associated protein Cas5/CasD [Leptolyngbya sp. 7M]